MVENKFNALNHEEDNQAKNNTNKKIIAKRNRTSRSELIKRKGERMGEKFSQRMGVKSI